LPCCFGREERSALFEKFLNFPKELSIGIFNVASCWVAGGLPAVFDSTGSDKLFVIVRFISSQLNAAAIAFTWHDELRVGSAGKCQDSRGADSKRNNGGGRDNQIYYEGMRVLVHEPDFYDLIFAYLAKAHSQNVRYVETFFMITSVRRSR
jgi:hypothetical protein